MNVDQRLALWRYLFTILLLAVPATMIWKSCSDEAARRERSVVWLPYGANHQAFCMQGPFGTFTHQGGFAWDFGLEEGKPVVAVAEGRVIRLVDDREETGFNSFNDSNQIFVDHGGGVFATYLHHQAGSAKVRAGELVTAGTHLADVGKVGTVKPHIHFDVRGPSWHQTHDVRFRTAADDPVEVRQGRSYLSATPPRTPHPAQYNDSMLAGEEFAANGVQLWRKDRGHHAFRLRAETPIVYHGRVPSHVKEVFFFLWKDGQPSEYMASAVPYTNDRFELEVRVPASSRGPRWYRITAYDAQGRLADVATLPVLVE